MATTESMFPDRSDFDYDYETLRTTGVVLAVVMFVSGILIALSKKFTKCFQLIWYPNSKDRGASSNCIENIILERGGSHHGNHASKNAHKHWLFRAIPVMANIPLPAG